MRNTVIYPDGTERTLREYNGKTYAISEVFAEWSCSHEAIPNPAAKDEKPMLDDCDECWYERDVYVNNERLFCSPSGKISVQQPSKRSERPELDDFDDFQAILGEDIYKQLTSSETPELDEYHKKLLDEFKG